LHQFLGHIKAKVDGKGRLFVPAVYRKSLEKSGEDLLYMEWDSINGCVKLYPRSVWSSLDEEFKSRLNRWDRNDQKLYRQFASRVEQVELDTAGRVLIPREFLQEGEMESDALFVGVGDYFEIWNKENFEASLYNESDFEKAMQQKMGNDPVNL
jgi:MraZ protein